MVLQASSEDCELAIDWEAALSHLDGRGFALLSGVLSRTACEDIAALYAQEARFRSRIEMARHGFGRGEYKYFKYPLPSIVEQLRTSMYPRIAPLANEW